jgi:hypothetical protein
MPKPTFISIMKKLASYVTLLIPIITLSSNPPPPGLPDQPQAVPIDSIIYVLLAAGILFGSYIIYKKNKCIL